MKKTILIFLTVILFLFTACGKEELDDDIVIMNGDKHSLTSSQSTDTIDKEENKEENKKPSNEKTSDKKLEDKLENTLEYTLENDIGENTLNNDNKPNKNNKFDKESDSEKVDKIDGNKTENAENTNKESADTIDINLNAETETPPVIEPEKNTEPPKDYTVISLKDIWIATYGIPMTKLEPATIITPPEPALTAEPTALIKDFTTIGVEDIIKATVQVEYKMKVGETSKNLTSLIQQAHPENKIVYYIENPNIVSINSQGIVTAKSKGKTVVSAKYAGKEIKTYYSVE